MLPAFAVSAAGFAFQGGVVPGTASATPRSAAPVAVVDATTLEYVGAAVVLGGGGFVAYQQQNKQGSVATKETVVKSKGVVAPVRSNKKWPMVGGSGGPHRMA